MDLDLWDCFGRKKLHLIFKEIRYMCLCRGISERVDGEIGMGGGAGKGGALLPTKLNPSFTCFPDLDKSTPKYQNQLK